MLSDKRKAELRLIASERYVPDVEKVTRYLKPVDMATDGPEINYLRGYYNGPGPRTRAIPFFWMAM